MNWFKKKINTSERIFKRSIKASYKMACYPEELSRDGIAEVLIFCTCLALYKERNKEVIEDVLTMLIRFIAEDSAVSRDIDKVAEHVTMRIEDYTKIITEIIQNPYAFTLEPLYCSFYRYPFSDIHFAAVGPRFVEKFRLIVGTLVSDLLM